MVDDSFEQLLSEIARLPEMAAPERIDRFEVIGELGRGGCGVVYEARDTELGRHVAIKMLRPLADIDTAAFRAEAETVARLGHPNIVTLFDFGHRNGQPYLVFERLRGKTLDRRLREGPVEHGDAVEIVIAILRGLAHAHRAGLIHRDVKPGNVFLVDDGPVKLLDFGLSVALGSPGRGGTPGYMAPEQGHGAEDARTDVFAVGVLLREITTGEAAGRFTAVIERATAFDPAQRFPDAADMLHAVLSLRIAAPRDELIGPGRRLAERQDDSRRARFVGRAAERELVRRSLVQLDGPRIFFVHGMPGIGKTALLYELAQVAADIGATATFVDGRDVEARPDGFMRALTSALGLPSDGAALDALSVQRRPQILLVDGYELLTPLDTWLRDWLLPRFPEHVIVILAGRSAPSREWRIDPAWRDLVKIIAISALDRKDSVALLERRNVPADRHERLLAFAHGHPLALAMAADIIAQDGDEQVDVAGPDLVHDLLRRFRDSAPSNAHRDALEAIAIVRTLTEPLLDELIGERVAGLFDWLAELSFVTREPRGLSLHQIVRDLVRADLRWRAPERHKTWIERAHASLIGRLTNATASEQLRATCDLMFIYEHHPAIAQFSSWRTSDELSVSSAMYRDVPALVEMVTKHEGTESGALATCWLERQLDGVQIIRDRSDAIVGFVATVTLTRARHEEVIMDPATRAAWTALGGTLMGGSATMFRFWMARDTYQSVSPIQNLCSALMVRHQLTTPNLRWALFPCADPEFWAPHMACIQGPREHAMQFEVGGRSYGVYSHDFRHQTPTAWLASLLAGGSARA